MVNDIKEFFKLFLSSLLGAVIGIMLTRINLYSIFTQMMGLLWFFSITLLFYIAFFCEPFGISNLINERIRKRKLKSDEKEILLWFLILLLLFFILLPAFLPAWFNS